MNPDEERLILDSVEKFLARDVAPYAQKLEADDTYPQDIVTAMKELGLFGAVIPPEYGGLGLPPSTYAKVIERIARVWMSVSGIINSHLIMAHIVAKMGTEEQKQHFLPKFASGEVRGGLALTEPDCGTDLQAIRTNAKADGNDYVVNGAKTWISNGIHGTAFALLVKTDPAAEPRHKGMSLFIAEKGEGFRATKKLEKLGYKGIDTAELLFEDFRVPGFNLIGGIGNGMAAAISGLELGRVNVAARGVGVAQAALDEAVKYAQTRKTFGKPIHQHRPPASSPKRRRRRWIAASAATTRPVWPSCSPPRPRWKTLPKRCASTAAMAIPRNSSSNASTATRPCSASARAPTKSSAC
jgi:alkylation response protein AidB-like acyl-CoA dehydrogenase